MFNKKFKPQKSQNQDYIIHFLKEYKSIENLMYSFKTNKFQLFKKNFCDFCGLI